MLKQLVLALVTAAPALAEPGQVPPAPTETAKAIVGAFDNLFGGPHPGARAVHAKGLLVRGTFEPTEAAARLSRAAHFQASVPVVVRFSNFAGIPQIGDGADVASPRGMSLKFVLPDGGDTDIVAHSYNGFPAGTAEDFLGFLRAVGSPDPAVLKGFLASHPAAQAFADTPKPAPASYATERFFGVNAFRFTSAAEVSQFGRYRIEPVAGAFHLTEAEAARRGRDYLVEELAPRLMNGPVDFRLLVQLAAPGDAVDDGAKAWPDERPTVDAGIIRLTTLVPQSESEQRQLLFTPLNLPDGISPSADPLLLARNRAYRVSFDRRRAEPAAEAPAAASSPSQ